MSAFKSRPDFFSQLFVLCKNTLHTIGTPYAHICKSSRFILHIILVSKSRAKINLSELMFLIRGSMNIIPYIIFFSGTKDGLRSIVLIGTDLSDQTNTIYCQSLRRTIIFNFSNFGSVFWKLIKILKIPFLFLLSFYYVCVKVWVLVWILVKIIISSALCARFDGNFATQWYVKKLYQPKKIRQRRYEQKWNKNDQYATQSRENESCFHYLCLVVAFLISLFHVNISP